MATPEEQAATMIANLPAKTRRSLQEWTALLRGTGLEKHGELVGWLKKEHGVGHGFANLIVHEHRKGNTATDAEPDLVAAQYQGKEALRPVYERIVEVVRGFGPDVELAPKKTYVSLRRSKQFGLVQPSTRTRVDLGLNLKDHPAGGRLEASGSFNAMVSHRVRLESVSDVDADVERWLRAAYEQS